MQKIIKSVTFLRNKVPSFLGSNYQELVNLSPVHLFSMVYLSSTFFQELPRISNNGLASRQKKQTDDQELRKIIGLVFGCSFIRKVFNAFEQGQR